ncbi:MAG: phosphoglycolate phosphatase [Zoogloeaceae bacterium]|jgi:phosphoglycolate phosphatase|nr:phosphoglycolate phosphatase [Zoogloeaceae bacterium]
MPLFADASSAAVFPASVTFDLDGTLLDTAPDLTNACLRALEDLGKPPRKAHEIRDFLGKGAEHLMRSCLARPEYTPSQEEESAATARFLARYAEENGRAARPYPHVEEGLRAFAKAGLPLAVVTNKRLSFAVPLLEKTGLARFFTVIVGGDSTPFLKPRPEPLLFACQNMRAAPALNLHIGDSENDALAARAAGCRVFLVPYGYTEGRAPDNALFDAPVSDLLAAFSLAQTFSGVRAAPSPPLTERMTD